MKSKLSKSEMFNEIIYALGVLSTNIIIYTKFREDKSRLELNEHIFFNNMLAAVHIIQDLISKKYSLKDITNFMNKAKIYPNIWKEKAIELNKDYKKLMEKTDESNITDLEHQYYS